MKHSRILPFWDPSGKGPLAPQLVDRAERELAFLHLRRRRLPARRLSDAHWAILLDLYVAHAQGREVCTQDLLSAAGVGVSTLLRYLGNLERLQLIVRETCEHDGRITLVRASEKGLARIATILGEATGFETDKALLVVKRRSAQ